jgi:alpha-glucuronidase
MKNNLNHILRILTFVFGCLFIPQISQAEDGYELWLRYKKVKNPALVEQYSSQLKNVVIADDSPTFTAAKNELKMALSGLLGKEVIFDSKPAASGSLIVGKRSSSNLISENTTDSELKNLGEEGYLIRTTKQQKHHYNR